MKASIWPRGGYQALPMATYMCEIVESASNWFAVAGYHAVVCDSFILIEIGKKPMLLLYLIIG